MRDYKRRQRWNGYEVSSDADPFYADTTSDLFGALQKIVDGRLKDDNLKTKAVEVHLWTEATAGKYEAYQQECYVVPTSYGGDTSGYQIPFTVNYTGERVKGKFDISSGTFTADSE